MRKHLILAGTALLSVASAWADSLTPAQALSRAKGNAPAAARAIVEKQQPQLVFTKLAADESPAAYVFAAPNQQGYMVLAADDVAVPVLGYSDNGIFDPENTNLQYWLGEYATQIAYAKAKGAQAANADAQFAPSNWAKIEPLCKTSWDQGKPYNNLCPMDGSSRSVTGCVATAMAQIMKYHNYPAQGSGNNLYATSAGTQVSVNFSDYKFAWTKMLNSYSSGYTAEQAEAVAQLMLCCGASVDMDYSSSQSGAQSAYVAKALINNFKYDKGLAFMIRSTTSLSDWQNTIYDNLKNVGPVYYSGQSAGGGHAFVCDGYDTNGYFHFNWGWSGASDGYYLLTALNPESQGIGGSSTTDGFNTEQRIIVGIQPEKSGSSYYYTMYWDKNFEVKPSEATLGTAISTSGAYSYTATSIAGSIGINVKSSNGTSQYIKGYDFNGLAIQTGYAEIKFTLPSSLADGTYTVSPAWQLNGSDEVRPVLISINNIKSYKMVVAGGKATFSPIAVDAKITIADIVSETPKNYVGTRLKFSAKATNNSNDEFYSSIQGVLFKGTVTSGTNPDYKGVEQLIDVEPGTTEPFEYISSFSAPKGSYTFCFIDPSTKEWLSPGIALELEAAPTNNVIEVSDFCLHGNPTTVNDCSSLMFDFDIKCTQGLFDNTLTICIIRGENAASTGTWASYFYTPQILLYDGESTEISAFGSISRPRDGYYYSAYLVDGKTNNKHTVVAGPYVFLYDSTYSPESGIAGIENDQNVVGVEIYNLQGVKVNAETAAPGLYIKVATYADGHSAASKVTIK